MEKVFVNGLIAKKAEKAPDFVLCNLSVKCDDFAQFMNQHQKNGWVNLSVLKSKEGKIYAQLDTYEPKQQAAPQPQAAVGQVEDDFDF